MTNLNEQTYVMAKMARLIDQEITGNASELSQNLRISRSLLFMIFDDWKSRGVDISYSRIKRSYRFSGEKKIKVNEPIQVVDNIGLAGVYGGNRSFPSYSNAYIHIFDAFRFSIS